MIQAEHRLRLFSLSEQVSCTAIGLEGVEIEDPKTFLGQFEEKFPTLIIQAIDARFIAGFTHAQMIMQQSWESSRRGLSYARKPTLDLLLRLALSNQIAEALTKVGLRKGTVDLAILAIGSPSEVKNLYEYSGKLGKISDKVILLSKRKDKFLRELHDISTKASDSTTIGVDPLAYLLAERAALLGAKL